MPPLFGRGGGLREQHAGLLEQLAQRAALQRFVAVRGRAAGGLLCVVGAEVRRLVLRAARPAGKRGVAAEEAQLGGPVDEEHLEVRPRPAEEQDGRCFAVARHGAAQ